MVCIIIIITELVFRIHYIRENSGNHNKWFDCIDLLRQLNRILICLTWYSSKRIYLFALSRFGPKEEFSSLCISSSNQIITIVIFMIIIKDTTIKRFISINVSRPIHTMHDVISFDKTFHPVCNFRHLHTIISISFQVRQETFLNNSILIRNRNVLEEWFNLRMYLRFEGSRFVIWSGFMNQYQNSLFSLFLWSISFWHADIRKRSREEVW